MFLTTRTLRWLRAPVQVTVMLHGFPMLKCGFDRIEVFVFTVLGVLLDGSPTSRKVATAGRATGIFRKNFRQCIRELAIKCRNVGAATHDLSPNRKAD